MRPRVICNVSSYIKKLSMVASVKLVNLFQLFGSPKFLYRQPNNHVFVQQLLTTFNNIIQYQYEGASSGGDMGPFNAGAARMGLTRAVLCLCLRCVARHQATHTWCTPSCAARLRSTCWPGCGSRSSSSPPRMVPPHPLRPLPPLPQHQVPAHRHLPRPHALQTPPHPLRQLTAARPPPAQRLGRAPHRPLTHPPTQGPQVPPRQQLLVLARVRVPGPVPTVVTEPRVR